MEDIEGRQLPELQITLDYMGWDEKRIHYFEGRIKILDAGDLFLAHLPAKLKKLKATDLDIEATNKRTATKEAVDWADELVGEFLKSGMFSRAVVDATGIEKGKYEYEPELEVVKARVYKVK
jgi:hypothetical protein